MKRILILSFLLYFTHSFCQSKEEKEGDAHFSIQNFEKAKNWYNQVYKTDPNNLNINIKLSQAYLELSLGQSALKHINKAFELEPSPKNELYFLKAQSLHLCLQFDSAAIFYQKSDPYNNNKKIISKKIIECEYGAKELKSPKNYKIRNLNQINSKAHDIAPKITTDFSQMYFTSQRSGTAQPENIYLSQNGGGSWTPPINIGSPINSEYNDACLGLSPDGQTMYIFKGINGGDIYVSELKGKKWSEPQALPFNTPHRETSVSVSSDGRTIYFVRQLLDEKGEKIGDSDIFYCKKTASGTWSKSVKMGGVINTIYDEESPFIHPDGKTLYFSSKGHSSIGGYDIFKSTWNGNDWTAPVNLGFPLNTAADERNFVIAANGDFALYAAEKENEGMGGLDIYFITMPPAPKPDLSLLKGKIIDQVTGKPIEAKITITENDKNEVIAEFYSNSETGEYLIALPSGVNYGISVEKELHLFYSENIYLKNNSGFKEQSNNVKLLNFTKGSTVILKNIFFESASYQLNNNSHSELNKLYQLLIDNPNLSIQISGHTDNLGNEQNNLSLSQKRAQAVLNFLVQKGIEGSRLKAIGYGSSKSIDTNNTEEGRAKNRRTEFTII